MRMTPKMIRAMFAKLKLLKLGATQVQASAAIVRPKMARLGIEQRDIVHLVSRVPKHHQQISKAKDFRLHNERSMAAAWQSHGALTSGQRPPVGFFDHFSGVLHTRVDPLPYTSNVGYSSRPAHIPRGMVASSSNIRRNAYLGSAKTFYHEYGHSVNHLSRFSSKPDWNSILDIEWDRVAGKEAWSEAYTLYATNKIGRNRLRKERPLSYEYMKKFFEET